MRKQERLRRSPPENFVRVKVERGREKFSRRRRDFERAFSSQPPPLLSHGETRNGGGEGRERGAVAGGECKIAVCAGGCVGGGRWQRGGGGAQKAPWFCDPLTRSITPPPEGHWPFSRAKFASTRPPRCCPASLGSKSKIRLPLRGEGSS